MAWTSPRAHLPGVPSHLARLRHDGRLRSPTVPVAACAVSESQGRVLRHGRAARGDVHGAWDLGAGAGSGAVLAAAERDGEGDGSRWGVGDVGDYGGEFGGESTRISSPLFGIGPGGGGGFLASRTAKLTGGQICVVTFGLVLWIDIEKSYK